MINYTFNEPDHAELEKLLACEPDGAGSTIVRLAWHLGLLRGEMQTLQWPQVDLDAAEVRLPDRNIPIPPEMLSYLAKLKSNRAEHSDYVIPSPKGRPFAEQYLSRLARGILDRAGQHTVRLVDLRHDYIMRQLREHDWQYVSQVSGIGLVSLRDHFISRLGAEELCPTPAPRDLSPVIEPEKIVRLIESERFSPAGTLICLSYYAGLYVSELQNLSWRQVDFSASTLTLPGRTVPLTAQALSYLRQLRERSGGRSDYVVISSRAGRKLETAYISKTARAALVSGGIHDVNLSDLRGDFVRRTQAEPPILALAKERGYVTRAEVIEHLNLTRLQAYSRLSRMVESGKLIRVGSRYYLPERTTPPDTHADLIQNYLRGEGSAVRQDFARLLNILPRQVYPILQKLVASGAVVLRDGRYYLPE